MTLKTTACFITGTAALGFMLHLGTHQTTGTVNHPETTDPHLQIALDLGLHRGDPTLDRLLARDLRFSGLTGTDAQLASEARQLGLTTRSTSARGRLHKRLEDIVLAGIPEPDHSTLTRHLQRHPELLPTREEVRLQGADGPTGWLGPADRARRHADAPVIARRVVTPDPKAPTHRAMLRAHWRSAELRRRWTELGEP